MLGITETKGGIRKILIIYFFFKSNAKPSSINC